MALRPRLQQLEPRHPGQAGHPRHPKTHPRLSFPPADTRRRSFFRVGAVIPSDHLQAVASISRKPSLFLVDPTQKRAGVAVPALVPATLATRQPIVSRRRSGISSWKRDGLGSGGRFFLDCVAASSMVQAEAGRKSRQRGARAAIPTRVVRCDRVRPGRADKTRPMIRICQ